MYTIDVLSFIEKKIGYYCRYQALLMKFQFLSFAQEYNLVEQDWVVTNAREVNL